MTTPDSNAFAAFIPGFEFLQNLTRQAAAGGASGQGSAVPGMPPMSHWVAPTFDVEELEKRIQDLKAVHFWLEQNTKALAATIQALEVQRMTLSTLQGMNVSMQEMADAFKAKPDDAQAASAHGAQPSAKPESSEEVKEPKESKASSQAGQSAQADPMQWWGALTEQFQTIAAGAMQDMNQQATQMMAAAQAADAKTPARKPKAAASKKTAASASQRKTASSSAKPAAKKSLTPARKTAAKKR